MENDGLVYMMVLHSYLVHREEGARPVLKGGMGENASCYLLSKFLQPNDAARSKNAASN